MAEVKEVRLYKNGDEKGITRLFKEVFGREMSIEEWHWKYREISPHKVYSSVAVNESDEIVAHYGGMPHRMVYQGKEVCGLAIGDIMVQQRFRSFKLFREIAAMVPEEAVKDGIILGYGFPNTRAMALPAKLGLYEKVEDVLEANKEVRFNNNTYRFFYKLFPLSFGDSRIDGLWESVKREFKLAVVRDGDYLRWRYQRHPFFRYELWGLKKRWSNELAGLAVLRSEAEKMLLVDFVCNTDMIGILFQKVENYSYACGMKNLSLWFSEYLRHTLDRLGFPVHTSCTCIPRTTHEETLTKDQIKGQFFYTMGDTDFL